MNDSIFQNPLMSVLPKDDCEDVLCKRGDVVDNAIYHMLCVILDLTPDEFEWDMSIIGEVADAVEAILLQCGHPLCRPWIEREGDSDDDQTFCCEVSMDPDTDPANRCQCSCCPMLEKTAVEFDEHD